MQLTVFLTGPDSFGINGLQTQKLHGLKGALGFMGKQSTYEQIMKTIYSLSQSGTGFSSYRFVLNYGIWPPVSSDSSKKLIETTHCKEAGAPVSESLLWPDFLSWLFLLVTPPGFLLAPFIT